MQLLPHLPALRRGKAYVSLDQVEVNHCRTGAGLARLSQVSILLPYLLGVVGSLFLSRCWCSWPW